VSCKTKSTDELAKTILVTPPKTNRKIKPETQSLTPSNSKSEDIIIVNHEKIFTLVGTPITIVAAVK
jgi:hypothetical protein